MVARGEATSSTAIEWTTTSRGSRSTSTPWRASSYRRRPSWWTAEYIGGICLIRPTNGRLASSRSRRSSRETVTSERARPSTSRVSVVSPKRTVATYSLSWSTRYGVSLVASPIRTGRTPVAFAPATHLHLAVALAEETRDAHRRHRARIIDELLGLDDLLRHGPRREDQPRDPPVVAHLDTSERRAEPAERIGGAALVEPL